MYSYLSDIKNKHVGEDIYIIGSGASMAYVSASFFLNKLTLGINYAPKFFPCEYTVIKDIVTPRGMVQQLQICKQNNSILMTPISHAGANHLYKTKHNYIVFPVDDWSGFVRTEYIGTDKIVNSHSTITSAMHIAYYLGAKNIILCGIDCGLLDGRSNYEEYYKNVGVPSGHAEFTAKSMSHPYHEWNIKKMRDELTARGCNVYSLNPFINIGLEGHKFTKSEISDSELWAGRR